MSPSSKTTVYWEQSWILVIVASTNSRRSGCFTSTLAPTRNNSHLIWSSETVPEPSPCLYATLHLMFRTTLRTFASQKAPLYLALTSVPSDKYGGSSTCCAKYGKRVELALINKSSKKKKTENYNREKNLLPASKYTLHSLDTQNIFNTQQWRCSLFKCIAFHWQHFFFISFLRLLAKNHAFVVLFLINSIFHLVQQFQKPRNVLRKSFFFVAFEEKTFTLSVHTQTFTRLLCATQFTCIFWRK